MMRPTIHRPIRSGWPAGRPARRQHGFTVVEMVIVVVIAAVLVALAAPNLSDFLKNNTRAEALNTMVGAITLARSHAVTNNVNVSICASSTGTSCAAQNFHIGYIAFVDDDRDGILDVGETVIRVGEPNLPADSTLVGDSDGGPVTALRFTGNGMAFNIVAGTHFRYCDDRGTPLARAVEVTMSGQPRISADTNGTGVDDVAGTDLVCP